ncbi:hypothetical protein MKZ38_003306 [Zalerion maritima]|uniref:Uncharacterized protein n=1 Tax=Zalerion maritima TaxID=339359 RepID=A0AAD5RN33_9PEZI|nr:hypothetical protein MKZ38_003306 [Zalerion maritima]
MAPLGIITAVVSEARVAKDVYNALRGYEHVLQYFESKPTGGTAAGRLSTIVDSLKARGRDMFPQTLTLASEVNLKRESQSSLAEIPGHATAMDSFGLVDDIKAAKPGLVNDNAIFAFAVLPLISTVQADCSFDTFHYVLSWPGPHVDVTD